MGLSIVSGGLAYFIPAAYTAVQATGQVVEIASPSPSGLLLSPTSSPSSPQQVGAFTVLLLGSDDDSKFLGDHVLTQSMILVRVMPATKTVVMLSIPRDLWLPLSTGGMGKIDGAYSYGRAGAAIATVQENFGVHINDYIWVGLLGLIRVIDAIGGEIKTSIPLSRVAALLPLASSFDSPDAIRTIVLPSPYTHGGAPDGSLYPNWGYILPLVHQYFP